MARKTGLVRISTALQSRWLAVFWDIRPADHPACLYVLATADVTATTPARTFVAVFGRSYVTSECRCPPACYKVVT